MVIGATGSIGSVSARLLAMAFDEVVTSPGATLSKLEALRDSILKERRTPRSRVPPTTTSCWATWT
jgi:saccharopine dehydrogenase-like NADP-dependent oxidoreductase